MKNAIHPVQPNSSPSANQAEHDHELVDEARLAADFTRLLQQYRRAGYEYFQRGQQSDNESVTLP